MDRQVCELESRMQVKGPCCMSAVYWAGTGLLRAPGTREWSSLPPPRQRAGPGQGLGKKEQEGWRGGLGRGSGWGGELVTSMWVARTDRDPAREKEMPAAAS